MDFWRFKRFQAEGRNSLAASLASEELTGAVRKRGSSPTELELKETLSRLTGRQSSADDPLPKALNEVDQRRSTAFGWSKKRKWATLAAVFMLQCSMNFNASVYSNAVPGMMEEFGISEEEAMLGQMGFLVSYAFGSMLWAPWSEEYGRWPVLQASLGFINIWQLPCALSQDYNTVLAGRILGGLSSAGGSVTLGLVADMFEPHEQQYAVNFIVLSSVLGSVLGPIFGGIIQYYLNWRWVYYIQLIFGAVVQAIHFCTRESRSSVLLDRAAKKLRVEGQNVVGPNEIKKNRVTVRGALEIWYRPFKIFATEPIVLTLSTLSGFSDALIFTFLSAFPIVFKQWAFGTIALGLTFVAIGLGYLLAYLINLPVIRSQQERFAEGFVEPRPEERLSLLRFTGALLPIGLAIFTGTSLGPDYGIAWICPEIAAVLIGIANSAIYMGTIDYMVAAYGPYASSASAGNALARDFLAGMAALYSKRMFTGIGSSHHTQWASGLLTILALICISPIYIFYRWGEWFRKRSKFAEHIKDERDALHSGEHKPVVVEENAAV